MRTITKYITCITLLFFFIKANGFNTTAEQRLNANFEKRVQEIFEAERGKPLVKAKINPPLYKNRPEYSRAYSFSIMEFASRCFRFNEQIKEANNALIENAKFYISNPTRIYDRDNVQWHSDLMCRLIEFYGENGSITQGLLSKEAENKMLEVLWISCKRSKPAGIIAEHFSPADHEKTGTWLLHGSENHHMMGNIEAWHFAKLAKERKEFKDRVYDDGLKAVDHYKKWTEYLNMYFIERAKKGAILEMMCIAYNNPLLKGIYNLYDFADDPKLKKRAGLFLDFYFAYWAQEQFNGTSGGGQSRLPVKRFNYFSPLGYLYFGVGEPIRLQSMLINAMTSNYRPPQLVADIVSDVKGRGIYEIKQRTLGLLKKGEAGKNFIDSEFGGIIRYSYCTPDFIIGTPMVIYKPMLDWAGISSQSRLLGVIFEGEDYPKIYPNFNVETGRGKEHFNAEWSVQKKGTLICQKLNTNKDAGYRRIFYSKKGLKTEINSDGWVFSEAKGAYAALKIVGVKDLIWGDEEKEKGGIWLICKEQNNNTDYAPVILEVAQKTEYASFEDFKKKVRSNSLEYKNDILKYTGIYGDKFTFYTNYSKIPEVNGEPINFKPQRLFDSPFLYSEWNSGIINIEKNNKKLVLDFN